MNDGPLGRGRDPRPTSLVQREELWRLDHGVAARELGGPDGESADGRLDQLERIASLLFPLLVWRAQRIACCSASAAAASATSFREESSGAGSPRSAFAGGASTGRTERYSGSITSEARRMARRMTFLSSRTFPGHR